MNRFSSEEEDIIFDALVNDASNREIVRRIAGELLPRLARLEENRVRSKQSLFGCNPYYSNICYLYNSMNIVVEDEDDYIQPPRAILNILYNHHVNWETYEQLKLDAN
jgi:hypothetical protein